jgi:hypothetical protein
MLPHITRILRSPDTTIMVVNLPEVWKVSSSLTLLRLSLSERECWQWNCCTIRSHFPAISEATAICVSILCTTSWTVERGICSSQLACPMDFHRLHWNASRMASTCSSVICRLPPALCHLRHACFSKCWCQLTTICLYGGLQPCFWWNLLLTVVGNLNSTCQ